MSKGFKLLLIIPLLLLVATQTLAHSDYTKEFFRYQDVDDNELIVEGYWTDGVISADPVYLRIVNQHGLVLHKRPPVTKIVFVKDTDDGYTVFEYKGLIVPSSIIVFKDGVFNEADTFILSIITASCKYLLSILPISILLAALYILAQGVTKPKTPIAILTIVIAWFINDLIVLPLLVAIVFWTLRGLLRALDININTQKKIVKIGILGLIIYVLVMLLNTDEEADVVDKPIAADFNHLSSKNDHTPLNCDLKSNDRKTVNIPNVLSAGVCQFGDYQVEFYQHQGAATFWLCNGKPFCGVQFDMNSEVDWRIDTIVKDSSGKIIASNLGGDVASIRLMQTPSNLPYMILSTNLPGPLGSANTLHLYTSKPDFMKVTSFGPVAPLSAPPDGFYTNDKGELLIDKIMTVTLPVDFGHRNWLRFPIPHRLVDDGFEIASEHIQANLRIYTESDIKNIYREARQIREMIDTYILDPYTDTSSNGERIKRNLMEELSSSEFFYQLGDLANDNRSDLFWEFFERAIPEDYDLRSEDYHPLYKTKKTMKATLRKWSKEEFKLKHSSEIQAAKDGLGSGSLIMPKPQRDPHLVEIWF